MNTEHVFGVILSCTTYDIVNKLRVKAIFIPFWRIEETLTPLLKNKLNWICFGHYLTTNFTTESILKG